MIKEALIKIGLEKIKPIADFKFKIKNKADKKVYEKGVKNELPKASRKSSPKVLYRSGGQGGKPSGENNFGNSQGTRAE